MKKYLLVNSLKFGGAEKVAQVLANANIFDGLIMLETDSDYTVNIPVKKLSAHNFYTNRILKTLFIPIYAWRLRKIVETDSVIVSLAERANFVNIFAKIFKSLKTVIVLPTNLKACFKNKSKIIYYFLIRVLYPFANRVVSVSRGIDDQAAVFIKNPNRRNVIYNPLDLADILSQADKPINFSENFLLNSIVLVGRLSSEKRQWVALKVFKEVLSKNSKAKLLIISDGPLRQNLLSYAEKLGLNIYSIFDDQKEISEDSNVYFLGYQKNAYSFLSKSTVFILCSLFEGFPMTILEALAVGTPVISVDCPYGPREILSFNGEGNEVSREESCGILVPMFIDEFNLDDVSINESEKKWALDLASLLSDSKKREDLIKKGKERVADFSIDKIKVRWEELFTDLIK